MAEAVEFLHVGSVAVRVRKSSAFVGTCFYAALFSTPQSST
jgi:hypothetical protein